MIVLDTGPVVAIANRDDADHERCLAWYDKAPRPLVLPAPILTEICYLLEREAGPHAEASFLRSMREERIELECLTATDVDRMAELVETYADLPLGAADASVVAVAERRRIRSIATLDLRHFTVVRPRNLPAFDLVPAR